MLPEAPTKTMHRRVFFLIRSLNLGGAERQLVVLARGLHACGVHVEVVTFYRGGAMTSVLREAGIPICELGKNGRWDLFGFLWRLVQHVRIGKPDVLYCFLPSANVLGALLRPLTKVPRVILGVRASKIDFSRYDVITRLEVRLAALLSRRADAIVCNSQAGWRYCLEQGYPRERLLVIHNGIDTDGFRFDATGRERLRTEWGVRSDDILIGVVARLDPLKDHMTFLRAVRELVTQRFPARFACVGNGSGRYAAELRATATRWGLDEHLLWVGELSDAAAVYSSLDVVCSPSISEGFSNAIAEGMACERVCVVTDVGDASLIIGDTGMVVEAQNSTALAAACRAAATMSIGQRTALGSAARARIQERFSLERLIHETEKLFGAGAASVIPPAGVSD